MRTVGIRLLLLGLLLGGAASWAEPPPEVEQLIRQLGDKRFAVREQATKKLWQLGPGVESALQRAAKDGDVEVAMRAKALLDKFAWGIFADTPPAIVSELERFRDGDSDARRRAALALAELGSPGLQALGRLRSRVDADDQRRTLNDAVALAAIRALPPLLKERKYDELQSLLEACLDRRADEAIANYVALVLLRGKLTSELARWQADHAAHPSPRSAEVLVALSRAAGNLSAARPLAAERPDLFEDILWEQGDWAELAKLSSPRAASDETDRRSPAVEAATRAAYCRLAGNSAGAKSHLDKLRQLGDQLDEFAIPKGLLLNECAAEAIERLSKSDPPSEIAFDLLVAQMRYREAFALADKILAGGSPDRGHHLAIQRARAQFLIGQTEESEKSFAAILGRIATAGDTESAVELVQAQWRVGLRDAARAAAATALFAAARQSADSAMDGSRRILDVVFPRRGGEAAAWWALLRQKYPNDDDAAAMRRLVSLIEPGREPPANLDELITALIAGGGADDAYAAVQARLAAATACEASGRLDDAVRHLTDAAARARDANLHGQNPFIRLGDLHAVRERFADAAEAYALAAERDPSEPVPVYLRGWALQRAGHADAGAAAIEDARLLALGDVRKRASVAEELARRDLHELARRERDLVVRLGWRRAWAAGNLLAGMARDAAARNDFARAADCYERVIVGVLASDFQFVEAAGYLTVPALVHAYRARAALAADRLDAVRAEADACLTLTPGHLDLALLVVPELTSRGRTADADAIYARAAQTYETMCKDHPHSAFAHNSAAWLAACCRRDLDRALEHARQATELAPKHAGYRDTLAEVHFQRGDRAKAIELMKECRRMEPNNSYFVKQLQRFEAGNPAVPPPPESDDN